MFGSINFLFDGVARAKRTCTFNLRLGVESVVSCYGYGYDVGRCNVSLLDMLAMPRQHAVSWSELTRTAVFYEVASAINVVTQ